MKNFPFLLVSFFFFTQIYSQTNYWEGNSTNWHNPANWSLNHVPNSTEDATIPTAGVTYYPNVYSGNAECKNLTIVSGANVELFNGISFHVYGDANISGSLIIDEEFTYIYLHDDIFWWSGSECINNATSPYPSAFYVYDDWNFESGSNVVLDKVEVTFVPDGTSSSIITCNSSTSSFYDLGMIKSAGSSVLLSGSSTQAMKVTDKLTIATDNNFYSYSNYDLVVYKHFDNNGHFYFVNGNLIIDDCDYNFHFNTGDFVNNLNMTTNSGYVAIVGDAIVNGDIEINGVGADVWNTLYLGGDFDNNAAGTDIDSININGSNIQNIYNLECNTLILDKPSGEMRFPSEPSVCDHYDWVQGSYRVNGGTFTINDLVDNGIFGTISITSGQLNIHQDAGQYVDMNATFFMTGGNCNIYGGGYESYWSYADDASITMSGGVLDFVDNGIRIYNTASHSFTENITGGTIRTPYHFRIYRDNFTPTGGSIQLYGTPDASITQVAGSNFHDLEISKSAKNYTANPIIHKSRDGEIIKSGKSNGVIANTDLDINGDFTLAAGSFSAPSIMNVGGNWDNQVGESAFFEAFGLVVFDGDEQAVINSSETFYNLSVSKTYNWSNALHLAESLSLNINNDFQILDGSMHVDQSTEIIVANDVLIEVDAEFSATYFNPLQMEVGGDWQNNNVFIGSTSGFHPGYSNVIFNGSTNQNIYSNCPDGDFANLTIQSTAQVNALSDLHLRFDFTIESGTFIAPPELYVGGDWTNNVGEAAFVEGSGLVVFNGDISKYCYGEVFNNLGINRFGEFNLPKFLIIPDGTVTTCQSFDWTLGGIQVEGGIFTAYDLADNGIYCDIRLYGGEVNLHQGTASGEFVDLNTSLTITDGTMRVYGGVDDSYWTWGADASITMSGIGSLRFEDVGIRVYNNPSFTFTENITGGTIHTVGNFLVERDNFNPSNNRLYMDGPDNATISLVTGSSLFYLDINKSSKSTLSENYIKHPRIKVPANESKSNTVTAVSVLDINGDFTILSGSFIAPAIMNVAQDWDNIMGESAFVEGTGLVVFDGAIDADIKNTETFYNLTEDKTSVTEEALEIIEPKAITVLNDLEILDGKFYMNNNTTLNIDNDLIIADESRLKANNGNITIGGDWDDNNTSDVGFFADYSTVTFNGPDHQYLFCDYLYAEFNNLIIDKPGGTGMDSFEPLTNVRLFGDLQVIDGNWYDTPSDNNHMLFGDLIIGPYGRWTDNNGIITLGESTTQSFVNDGGGYFDVIVFDKNNPTDQVDLSGNLVFDNLNINTGSVIMADSYYLNHESISVEANASLVLDAGTWLVSDDGANINVAAGGRMTVNGTDIDHCVITQNGGSGYYNFNVDGELGAGYTEFGFMSANGVQINPGAILTSGHAFNNCIFSNGESGGTYLTINNNQTLTSDGINFNLNNWGGNSNVKKTVDFGQITYTNSIGDFTGEAFDDDIFDRIIWDEGIREIDVRVYLEGPFNEGIMETALNIQELIPKDQPYDVPPWNYPGFESVVNIPNPDIVDWVLIEYRDAPNAVSATPATSIGRQAAFLLNNGDIVDIDGNSILNFPYALADQLFIVIRHRNHLAIMSAAALTESSGVYSYDFTISTWQAYGTEAQKNLGSGIYGLNGGDGNADGTVNTVDKTEAWSVEAGTAGYSNSDFNMDSQIDNTDKNDIWTENNVTSSQIPD